MVQTGCHAKSCSGDAPAAEEEAAAVELVQAQEEDDVDLPGTPGKEMGTAPQLRMPKRQLTSSDFAELPPQRIVTVLRATVGAWPDERSYTRLVYFIRNHNKPILVKGTDTVADVGDRMSNSIDYGVVTVQPLAGLQQLLNGIFVPLLGTAEGAPAIESSLRSEAIVSLQKFSSQVGYKSAWAQGASRLTLACTSGKPCGAADKWRRPTTNPIGGLEQSRGCKS